MNGNNNWKSKLMLVGTLTGAILGLVTAVLLVRTAEEDNGEINISTSDLIKTSITVIGAMRGVAALGGPK